MTATVTVDAALHRQLAVSTFNATWGLLDKPDRTPEDDEAMVHLAHASRYHWTHAGTGLEWARGEWQLARVYAMVGRAEPALHHAAHCLALCSAHDLGAFDRAYAHEALARANLLAGRPDDAARHRREAAALAATIPDAEERALVESDLATLAD